MKQLFLASLLGSTIAMCTAAMAADTDLKTLEAAAKAEGAVNSVGMPDDWANWKGTWEDLAKNYGLKHMDTDMSSAQEIAKFKAEKDNASADIGDVGAAFGPIAVKMIGGSGPSYLSVSFRLGKLPMMPSYFTVSPAHRLFMIEMVSASRSMVIGAAPIIFM